jgi:hypothetical protein
MNQGREDDILAGVRIHTDKFLASGKEGVLTLSGSGRAEDLALLASQGAAELLGGNKEGGPAFGIQEGADCAEPVRLEDGNSPSAPEEAKCVIRCEHGLLLSETKSPAGKSGLQVLVMAIWGYWGGRLPWSSPAVPYHRSIAAMTTMMAK